MHVGHAQFDQMIDACQQLVGVHRSMFGQCQVFSFIFTPEVESTEKSRWCIS